MRGDLPLVSYRTRRRTDDEAGTPDALRRAMHASPESPRATLEEDHLRIDALLDDLVCAVRADDREAASLAWTRAEDALLQHFDVEEMLVFPALTDTHAIEVEALRREHDDMRRMIGELGLTFDLHTTRCAPIEALCTRIRDHARREDALAYRVAESRLEPSAARAIFRRIRGIASPHAHTEVARTA